MNPKHDPDAVLLALAQEFADLLRLARAVGDESKLERCMATADRIAGIEAHTPAGAAAKLCVAHALSHGVEPDGAIARPRRASREAALAWSGLSDLIRIETDRIPAAFRPTPAPMLGLIHAFAASRERYGAALLGPEAETAPDRRRDMHAALERVIQRRAESVDELRIKAAFVVAELASSGAALSGAWERAARSVIADMNALAHRAHGEADEELALLSTREATTVEAFLAAVAKLDIRRGPIPPRPSSEAVEAGVQALVGAAPEVVGTLWETVSALAPASPPEGGEDRAFTAAVVEAEAAAAAEARSPARPPAAIRAGAAATGISEALAWKIWQAMAGALRRQAGTAGG